LQSSQRTRPRVNASWILGLLLAVTAVWGYRQYIRAADFGRQIDDMNEMSYYQLVDSMQNIDVNLSKLIVASAPGEALELLSGISRQSDFATASIASLPSTHPAVMDSVDFLNTLGDYCRALINETGDGQVLDSEDYNDLVSMRDVCVRLREVVMNVQTGKAFEYDGGMYEDIPEGVLIKAGEGEESIEYPTIIYDGPFSEALDQASPKGLVWPEVTQEQAAQAAAAALGCDVSQLSFDGEVGGKMPGYSFGFNNEKFCNISRSGGKVLWIMGNEDCEQEVLNETQLMQMALDYLASFGYSDMEVTWSQVYDCQMVMSFAGKQEGVLIYPDLIKIKLNMDEGNIIAFDATGYYMNHIDRSGSLGAALSHEQARDMVSPLLEPVDTRLCVIPAMGLGEILCWEFTCVFNNETYYVYINANTGKQEKIYKVVDTVDGSMLV